MTDAQREQWRVSFLKACGQAGLSSSQREAAELHCIDGLSALEIARRLHPHLFQADGTARKPSLVAVITGRVEYALSGAAAKLGQRYWRRSQQIAREYRQGILAGVRNRADWSQRPLGVERMECESTPGVTAQVLNARMVSGPDRKWTMRRLAGSMTRAVAR